MDGGNARALYELMMITAWADGRLDMSETLVAEAVVNDVPEIMAVPDRREISQRARQQLQQHGLREALKQAAANLGEAWHRELAFICCARVLEADGIIAQEEFTVLIELRKLFGLKPEDVQRLLTKP
ncbi:MAG TPA: tellurite resistance TerB family protein [Myxococcales bacterium]|nr:tellurite resistance TerB family protein [Myxococcales bacterium]